MSDITQNTSKTFEEEIDSVIYYCANESYTIHEDKLIIDDIELLKKKLTEAHNQSLQRIKEKVQFASKARLRVSFKDGETNVEGLGLLTIQDVDNIIDEEMEGQSAS